MDLAGARIGCPPRRLAGSRFINPCVSAAASTRPMGLCRGIFRSRSELRKVDAERLLLTHVRFSTNRVKTAFAKPPRFRGLVPFCPARVSTEGCLQTQESGKSGSLHKRRFDHVDPLPFQRSLYGSVLLRFYSTRHREDDGVPDGSAEASSSSATSASARTPIVASKVVARMGMSTKSAWDMARGTSRDATPSEIHDYNATVGRHAA